LTTSWCVQARIVERAAIESTKLARATAKSQRDAELARRQQLETEVRHFMPCIHGDLCGCPPVVMIAKLTRKVMALLSTRRDVLSVLAYIVTPSTHNAACVQESLSALDLEAKREATARAQEALNAEEKRLDRLTADAEEAQARAADLNSQVLQKVR